MSQPVSRDIARASKCRMDKTVAVNRIRSGRIAKAGVYFDVTVRLFPFVTLGYLPPRWPTWRRFGPSSSPSASFATAARSLRENVGTEALAAISHLSSGLLIGRVRPFFSEWRNSLQSSGRGGFGTVLEIHVFRAAYEF